MVKVDEELCGFVFYHGHDMFYHLFGVGYQNVGEYVPFFPYWELVCGYQGVSNSISRAPLYLQMQLHGDAYWRSIDARRVYVNGNVGEPWFVGMVLFEHLEV